MESPLEELKKKGVVVTPQRLAIYKFLRENKGHFTAEDIYGVMKRRFPTISLATIYSVLELLEKQGLIRELRIRKDKKDFDSRIDLHHHLLCRKCARIIDIDIPLCNSLKNMEIEGNIIEEAQGYFYGVCKKCRKSLKGEG